MTSDSLKNQRQKHNGNEEALQNSSNSCPFESLTQDIIFAILDSLALTHDSLSLKSFSLTSKSFYYLESLHRKSLKPLRSQLLPRILRRYSSISRLDLTLCPRVDDHTLSSISSLCKSRLRSIDLSRSRFFTSSGLSYSVTNCSFLVEIDLSNATTLTDSAAAVIAEAKNLERLWLVRCKLISDIGIGCVAVGCRKLRLLSLKWCCRVSDLGVGLIAMKCEDLRSLDLSYLPITEKCLSSILRLQSLEDLVLVACVGLDDDGLRTLKHGCRSLERLDVSNCQSIGHLGLSSFTEGSTCLRLLVLSYGCSVTAVAAKCLQNFSLLQSIKLDGCLVTCCGMKAIGNWCASLVELSLSKCSGVTDVGLCSIVETQKELKKLDITCCRWISYISIDSNTRSCTSLTSLRMESCTQVSKEAFVLIGKCCPFLEELDVTDNEIDDEGLKSISSCSKLCSLKVGICLNVTDQGLISIGMSCSELAELDLYRCLGITDVGVASVAQGCPKLRVINVEYCNKVIDTSLRMLSNCLGLKALEARGCPCISSVGLLAIAEGCRLLTMLDIKNCYNINDSGMVSLACYSQNLKQINLSYCSVTDVGLLALASIRQLQNMTVLHLTGLTPNGLASALLAS